MILHLSGDVDYEMLNSLVKSYNGLGKDEVLDIYFTSDGGLCSVCEALIYFINKYSEFVTITFYGGLFSAAMLLFLSVKCKRILLKDTIGMFHLSSQEMTISEGGKPSNDYDIFYMKEMKKSRIRTAEFLKTTKLNEKEISLIKKGKDCFFSYERMQELM